MLGHRMEGSPGVEGSPSADGLSLADILDRLGTGSGAGANRCSQRTATGKQRRAILCSSPSPDVKRRSPHRSASSRKGPSRSCSRSPTSSPSKRRPRQPQQELDKQLAADEIVRQQKLWNAIQRREREKKDLQHEIWACKDKEILELREKVSESGSEIDRGSKRDMDVKKVRHLQQKEEQVHEKERDVLGLHMALQLSLQKRNAELEAELRKGERKEEEVRILAGEVQRLRADNEALLERLSGAEEARERHAPQAQIGRERQAQQEKLAALENSLREETAARRHLVARQAQDRSERQEVETELATERRRTDDMQRQIAALEESLRESEARRDRLQEAAQEDRRELEQRIAAAEPPSVAAYLPQPRNAQPVVQAVKGGASDDVEEELRRWREWADEQALRELTAETQRLDELRRVREDIGRQVEEARRDVLEENRGLQRKLRELEAAGPTSMATSTRADEAQLRAQIEQYEQQVQSQTDAIATAEAERVSIQTQLQRSEDAFVAARADLGAVQKDLAEVSRRAEEDRQSWQARLSNAEAHAQVTAEDFSKERSMLQSQIKALQVQCGTVSTVQREEFESLRAAEREAVKRHEKGLEEALVVARESSASLRWQLVVRMAMHKREMASVDTRLPDLLHRAHLWRERARGHECDSGRLSRQDTELERLEGEAESLQQQNRQLLTSLQQAQQELQVSLAETKRLQEREAAYEDDIRRISERSAELGGHANLQQKIRHLTGLKDENQALRQDLRRAKQRAVQFESQLCTAQFFESSGTVGSRTQPATHGRQTPRAMPATSRTTPRRSGERGGRSRDMQVTPDPSSPGAASVDRQSKEASRHDRAHQRVAERAVTEYMHLATLVEQVLALDPEKHSSSPGRGPQCPRPEWLLHRLRSLAAHFSAGAASGAPCDAEGNEPEPLQPKNLAPLLEASLGEPYQCETSGICVGTGEDDDNA